MGRREVTLMATVSLNLPDDLRARAEARAAESGFATVEQYVEQLVRTDADAGDVDEVDEDLERLLLDRLDGPGMEVNREDFQRMRAKLQARLDSQAKAQP
jgi:hypothetical protein